MVGKTDLTDLAVSLLFVNPFFNTQDFQFLPGVYIGEHMHQVVIHMICPQPFQLFLEQALHACFTLNQIVGEFGCNIYLLTDTVFLQNLTQGSFAATVDVGGIEIVHPGVKSKENLPFRFF